MADYTDEEIEELIRKEAEEAEKDIEVEEVKQRVLQELQDEDDSQGLIQRLKSGEISRRDFLKGLGIGAGGLALSSTAAGKWALWQPKKDGVSDMDADTVDGKHASEIGVASNIIVIWSGSISNIPSGWVLCDGNNGTPNLQDRFVVGAGSTYAVDGTGGESTHTLTTSELASHVHDLNTTDNSGGGTTMVYTNDSTGGSQTVVGGGTYGVQSTGGDSAHENRPPYYALAYIMKT